jgi:hypothetical protein
MSNIDVVIKLNLNSGLLLNVHNSHFTEPLFKPSWTEYEIGQYNTIQYNAKIQLCNQSCHS